MNRCESGSLPCGTRGAAKLELKTLVLVFWVPLYLSPLMMLPGGRGASAV